MKLLHCKGAKMEYSNIKQGVFLARPNRFIAKVEIDGIVEICHVKNTGRCAELLTEKAVVYVEENNNPARKTRFSLIAVQKGKLLINMDSQAPNQVVREWLSKGGLGELSLIKPESKYGSSRLDFYVESKNSRTFIEVKGVTLEDDGIVRFPDAPTVRGLKHVYELCKCVEEGYSAYIIFVVQMEEAKYFEPNWETQPAFGEALQYAAQKGVKILAYSCLVETNSLNIKDKIAVKLEK